jgi:anti-sigma factor RsiW
MYVGSYDWQMTYARERYQDLLEEAAHERRIREVKLAQRSDRARHRRFLTWLGRRMMAIGCWLATRYGPSPEIRRHNGQMGAPRPA